MRTGRGINRGKGSPTRIIYSNTSTGLPPQCSCEI